jgi:DNA replication protein DnaC
LKSCESNLTNPFQSQIERWKSAPIESPAEAAKRAERVAERQAAENSQRRGNAISVLQSQVGVRYSKCTLKGFTLAEDGDIRREQETVLSRITDYRDSLRDRIEEGAGLFLFGPAGTGKDHLLSAVMFDAVRLDFRVSWFNGQDLFGKFRDVIQKKTSEREVMRTLIEPHVLALSDPIPPTGELTPFQQTTLFRAIDRRYRDCKPTWLTANIATGGEAEARLGVQLFERLKHGALCLPCNWPSHRVSRR